MPHNIEPVTPTTYPLFEDMVFWRENGFERAPLAAPPSPRMQAQLATPNFYVFAARVGSRYVGWISLTYIPKIGSRWGGRGHVYVDELWVAPAFRGQGIAKALMARADALKEQYGAAGVRLYVNVNNPTAQGLYQKCGYAQDGQAIFMEKK